jgi:hypothetical protein
LVNSSRPILIKILGNLTWTEIREDSPIMCSLFLGLINGTGWTEATLHLEPVTYISFMINKVMSMHVPIQNCPNLNWCSEKIFWTKPGQNFSGNLCTYTWQHVPIIFHTIWGESFSM